MTQYEFYLMKERYISIHEVTHSHANAHAYGIAHALTHTRMYKHTHTRTAKLHKHGLTNTRITQLRAGIDLKVNHQNFEKLKTSSPSLSRAEVYQMPDHFVARGRL